MTSARVVLIRNAAYCDFGGGERFPVFVAEELVKHGYSPIIITRSPMLLTFSRDRGLTTIRGWWWPRQNWSGWRVGLFPLYILWQVLLTIWYLAVFTRLQPQAVHIQSKDDFIAATLAARVVGARVIWTDHADLKHIWLNLSRPFKNPIGKLVYATAHAAHAITLVSEGEKREVTAHLPTQSHILSRISVIYNGCLDQSVSPIDELSGVFTFCSINRLVTDKGIGEMLSAFKAFYRNHPKSRLLLVGDGPEVATFRSQAANDPSVSFLGYQAEPLAYVASSDVFLQPTYHEGFSVALVEACMLGMPIIATDVGGNPEIITDHDNGLLIPARDSASLLAAMEELYTDKSLRNRLGQRARKRYLAEFQFDQIVKERFMPLYENTRH